MKMTELKSLCNKLSVSFGGKKGAIIERIKHYLLTGEILEPSQLPEISKAKSVFYENVDLDKNFSGLLRRIGILLAMTKIASLRAQRSNPEN